MEIARMFNIDDSVVQRALQRSCEDSPARRRLSELSPEQYHALVN
jgi:hypothetical protein